MSPAIGRHLLNVVLPSALAATALGMGLLTDQRRLVFLIAAAALAVMVWRRRSLVAGPVHVAPRLVLTVAVASAYPAAGAPAPHWPLLLAGAVLAGLLLAEAPVYRAGRPLYQVANLPERDGWRGRLSGRRAASAGNTVLLAAVILFALAGWPGWPVLVAAVVAAAVTGGAAVAAVRLRLFGRNRALARLRQRVADHRPVFMVYFTAPPGSGYQLMMWLPHLAQIGERFLVVLREPHAFPATARATGVPVIYAPEMSTFDVCVVPSLKAAFYVNNGARNTHSVRYGGLTHIFLNHGDSDKPSSFNPVTAMYDRVFVAGQAGIDRYSHHGLDLPPDKFRIVGRPQVATAEPARWPVAQVTHPVVLYAPTWTGYYADANYSSLPIAATIVRALLDHGATVILRHHPYSMRNRAERAQLAEAHRLLAADAAGTGRRHRWGAAATTGMSLIECFNASDALVSDVSSVASEYLYSEKPFAITDMTGQAGRFAESFPLARVGYGIDPLAANLADVLDRLLKADPDRSDRLRAKVHYLGDFPRDRYADAFLTEARRYL